MSINRVMISGNLTRDAELRNTATGLSILNLGVAVNDRRKNNQTGQWEDVPNFVDCVMFGSRADALAQYLTKGTKVAIEGKLRWSSWQQQDGQKRNKLEVIVDEIEFMSRNNGGGASAPNQYAQQNSYQQPQQNSYQQPAVDTSSEMYGADIPF